MLNWRTTSYLLTRAKGRQCLMTLPEEDQAMIHLETKRQCIILRDEMKVLIVITLSTSLTTRSDDKEILDGLTLIQDG